MAIVQGKAMWAKVFEPDTTFTPKYEIDLIVEDKKYLKILKDLGLKPKKNEDGSLQFKFSTNAVDKEGNPKKHPRVVDRYKKPFNELIGNGSIVNVMFTAKEWTFHKKKGVKGYLQAVQVVEHVPYGDDFDVLDDEEDIEETEGGKEEKEEEFDDVWDD